MNEVAAPIHPHAGKFLARYEHGGSGTGPEVFDTAEAALTDYIEHKDADPDDVVYIYRVVAVKRLVAPQAKYEVEDYVPAGDAQ